MPKSSIFVAIFSLRSLEGVTRGERLLPTRSLRKLEAPLPFGMRDINHNCLGKSVQQRKYNSSGYLDLRAAKNKTIPGLRAIQPTCPAKLKAGTMCFLLFTRPFGTQRAETSACLVKQKARRTVSLRNEVPIDQKKVARRN